MVANGGPQSEVADKFLDKLLQPDEWCINYNCKGVAQHGFAYDVEDILKLIRECTETTKEQDVLAMVESPVKVFGDIHGQYSDLMRFFWNWGMPDNGPKGDIDAFHYLFLGDYIDRGCHSLETICLLMALKVKYPKKITLLRGNHEDSSIATHYGFLAECRQRLTANYMGVFDGICEMFEWLPLAAIINSP